MKRFYCLVLILLFAGGNPAKTEVIDSTEAGFLSKNEAVISATPDEVYRALVEKVAECWDPAHTFSGDAKNLSIDPTPGGCFCERLPNNGGVRHMTVVFVSPGRALRHDAEPCGHRFRWNRRVRT